MIARNLVLIKYYTNLDWDFFRLKPNKAGVFEGSFSWGEGGSQFDLPHSPLFHISRSTYPISIKLYITVKQSI